MTKSTELTLPQRAAVALGSAEHEAKLKELAAKNADIVEIKNGAGRDQCHSAMMVLANARVTITKSGKEAREDATKFSKAVIEEEKRLIAIIEPEEARLRGLRDDWDEAREREKQAKAEAEARRISLIREAIDGLRAFATSSVSLSPAKIAAMIETLEAEPISIERYAEMTGIAEVARGETLDKLRQIHAQAVEREAEAARLAAEREELVRLRAEEEKRQAAAAAQRAEEERQARAAREAEEKRLADERAAQEAELRAQREAQERKLAAERAEAARIASERLAAEAAARAEADRIAREKLAAEEAEMRAARAAQEEESRRLATERAEFERQQAVAAAERRLQEEAARAAKEAVDTQIRNAAPLLLEACQAALAECPDLNCAAQLRTAIDAATVVDAEFFEAA